MTACRLAMRPVHSLKPHERVDPRRLREVLQSLWDLGVLEQPLIVDAASGVILDGHHRHAAFLELGLRKVPCLLVDYASEEVQLEPRRADVPVSKAEVLRRAHRGELYPPKTTRHRLAPELARLRCSLPLRLSGCLLPRPA